MIAPLIAALSQEISGFVLLPGIGMLLVGLGFLVYMCRRRLGWRYAVFGALAWVISVAFKFGWAIAMNTSIYIALTSGLPAPLGSVVFYVYVGLLTGVFEVALVWVVLSRIRWGRATWNQALAFGIGFGAVEAILLGASSLAGGLTVLLAPDQVPTTALAQFALASNPLYGAAPVVERAATIFVHILSAGLIFYAIVSGSRRWVWLAIIYKTGLDSVAAFAQFWGVDSVGRVWTIEAILILFGLLGWWGVRRLADLYPETQRLTAPDPAPQTFA